MIRIYSTSNCARLAELRRGMESATINSLAFSPSAFKLACTSNKATLHIFDVPHPDKPKKPVDDAAAAPTSILPGPGDGEGRGKWGILGKIPLLPKMFSDVYSFTSAPFEMGDEGGTGVPVSGSTTLGTSEPAKGITGWLDEDSLVVVGAGVDARWEKFNVLVGEDGRRYCAREGWKRYIGSS